MLTYLYPSTVGGGQSIPPEGAGRPFFVIISKIICKIVFFLIYYFCVKI
nr:MAG TPA: hypothetical protein [Caudoviricetes sp.]